MNDDETVRLFIEESQDHLGGIEQSLLQIEADGANINADLVNQVFRAIHSIKGGAGFFGLDNIKNLSHDMENVLNQVREGITIPTPEVVGVLLESADLLTQMVNDWSGSNDVDISSLVTALREFQNVDAADQADPEAASDASGEEAFEVFDDAPVVDQTPETAADQVFRLEIGNLGELHAAGKSWDELVDEIRRVGEIAGANCAVESGPADETSLIELFISSVVDEEVIRSVLNLPQALLHAVPGPATPDAQQATETTPEPQAAPAQVEPAPTAAAAPQPAPSKSASPKPAPAKAEPPKPAAAKSAGAPVGGESSLRVNVRILDRLMNLAGELVLTRNQLSQAISMGETRPVEQASQRLDQITSEMQEAIMSTRMQPVAVVFSKFRRIVRDLAGDLAKQIDLQVDGEDVELDKTIIEGLSDPLTHLVRNAIDHGVEMPADRVAKGKPEKATLNLRAFHEAGQVVIEIQDDGGGIDPERIRAKALDSGLRDRAALEAMPDTEVIKLIFAPGFSTAAEVTDISGRGVGMDVVNTNLSQMGGVVDLESQVDVGTIVRIKLPLTLAIIPSLVVRLGSECYALPQVNVQELVRVPPKEVGQRLQMLGDALILRLRGDLLPVVSLREVVGGKPTYTDPVTGEEKPDRRQNLHDRRGADSSAEREPERRKGEDRRRHIASGRNIVVVQAGALRFGIVVDELLDSEEIVVKPLDSHLKSSRIYAGATIRGDGRVSMILDVVELARFAQLDEQRVSGGEEAAVSEEEAERETEDQQSLVIVQGAQDEIFAVPVPLISRIEKVPWDTIRTNGSRRTIIYGDGSLPLFSMDDVAEFAPIPQRDHVYVIVFTVKNREVGLIVASILDTVNLRVKLDRQTFKQAGIFGSAIIKGSNTFLIDLHGLVGAAEPDWVMNASEDEKAANANHTVLIVEDSKFFMEQISAFVTEAGYKVVTAMDGLLGLEQLEAHDEISCVLTDIEMPNMDGLEFTRAVRADPRFRNLPVIAVTSVAGDASEKRGYEAGVNAYLIKLDKEEILSNLAASLGDVAATSRHH